MTYIQRLWLTIIRKSRHSIYLFLLVFLFAMLGVVAYYFRNISDSYQQSVISDIGYSLMLYRTDENSIEQELLDDICYNVEGVLGYNQENNMLITPVDFQNTIASDETNVFSVPQSEMVRLIANTDTTLSPLFSNHMRLLNGQFPSEDYPGVIIDVVLAESNHLSVGDTITVSGNGIEDTTVIYVSGIYETTSFPQEEWTEASGITSYGQSPYSYIFCDYHSYENVVGFDLQLSSVFIYTESRKSLDAANTYINNLELDPNEYQVSNRTELALEHGTLPSQAINTTAKLLTNFSVWIAAIILFMVVILWMRNSYKDISILISLGESKVAVMCDYFIITTVIALSALILSIPVSDLLIRTFDKDLIEFAFSSISKEVGKETDKYISFAMDQSLGWDDYAKSNITFLMVVWGATLCASVGIYRCKPSKLFSIQ